MALSPLAQQTRFIDGLGQAELVSSGKVSALELLEAAIERTVEINPPIMQSISRGSSMLASWQKISKRIRSISLAVCHLF